MLSLFRRFESSCDFCDGKTKAETSNGHIACTTCGSEDSDFVPFFVESDFLREANKSRNSAFGVTEGLVERFVDPSEHAKLRKKRAKKVSPERSVEKNYNSPFLSDEEKRLELCEFRGKYVKRKLRNIAKRNVGNAKSAKRKRAGRNANVKLANA